MFSLCITTSTHFCSLQYYSSNLRIGNFHCVALQLRCDHSDNVNLFLCCEYIFQKLAVNAFQSFHIEITMLSIFFIATLIQSCSWSFLYNFCFPVDILFLDLFPLELEAPFDSSFSQIGLPCAFFYFIYSWIAGLCSQYYRPIIFICAQQAEVPPTFDFLIHSLMPLQSATLFFNLPSSLPSYQSTQVVLGLISSCLPNTKARNEASVFITSKLDMIYKISSLQLDSLVSINQRLTAINQIRVQALQIL